MPTNATPPSTIHNPMAIVPITLWASLLLTGNLTLMPTGSSTQAKIFTPSEFSANASFIGFTGTSVEKMDPNSRAVFSDYVSIYDT